MKKKFSVIKENLEKINCICNNNIYKVITDMIRCDSCNYIQHIKCIKNAASMENYECPTCQFLKMDFKIKTVCTLLNPSLIENVSKISKFNFNLSKEAFKIYSNMGNIFLFIRCIRLDNTGYENHWPFNCTIGINQIQFNVQFKKTPPRKMRDDTPILFYFNEKCSYYKKDQFKLDNFLKFDENKLTISTNFEENQDDIYNYAVTVELVSIINDNNDIIKNIPSVSDINIIRSRLKCTGNSIFYEEKINLFDIYNNNKMIKTPVRSINCQHLSVFDLGSYLSINSLSKNWNCPICRKKSVRLYKDDFLLKIINENLGIKEVKFNYNDLNYSVLKNECQTVNNIKKNYEIIDIQDDDNDIKTNIQIIDLNESNKAKISNGIDTIVTRNNLEDISIASPVLVIKEDSVYPIINEIEVLKENKSKIIADQNPKKNIVLTQNYYFQKSSLISHKRKQFSYLD